MTRGLPLFILAFLLLVGCGSDPEKPPVTPPQPDTTTPAAVTDLAVSATTDSSATLTWTAPGDDNNTGTVSWYDVRYSHLPFTPDQWGVLQSGPGRPVPLPAGTRMSFTVTGIPPGLTYYFALKAADEEQNWSGQSNVATAAVGPDIIAPSAVSLTVVAATDTSATIAWTASGDDWGLGTATRYDVRYSTTVGGMNAQWDLATQVENEPPPSPSGSAESMTVGGLEPGTTYFIGLKIADEQDNWSERSAIEVRTTSSADAHWSDLFDANGMDQWVSCLASYDGSLVAGGHFQSAGSVQAMGIARWDGSTWSTMGRFQRYGDSAFGPYALAVYRDALVAAGSFQWLTNDDGSSGGQRISSWKDGAWSWLGEGVSDGQLGNTECTTLLSFGDQLIVGGHFQKAGRVDADNVAAWDGQAWHALRGGLDDEVFSLASFNGQLIAGGFFGRSKIARYDAGTGWNQLGTGISGGSQENVSALTVFNGELIAAGDFPFAGGVAVYGIARWNGSAWQRLGGPGDGWNDEYPRVWALVVYNGRLIIGGDYSSRHHSCIATWDGSAWGQLGTGIGSPGDRIYALAVHDGKLFVGGTFTRAGDKVSRNIACWSE